MSSAPYPSNIGRRRFHSLRLLSVVVLWALTFRLLSAYGVELLPRSFARELTLEAYLALMQAVTFVTGVVLSFVILKEPRRDLAVVPPTPVEAAYALALTPAIFVLATGIAFQLARPTLLAELAHGGLAEVQKNTGEFGRELTQAPSWLAFVWGALVSPISEELFFRGVFFTLLLDLTLPERDGAREPASLSPELFDQSAVARVAHGTLAWLRRGGGATLVVALVFGFLHRDMPGGLGMVRFFSALGLGIACGLARNTSASVVPPALIHIGFNALSLATARHLVVSATFPMKSGVPTLVAAAGALGAWAVALHFLLVRRGKRHA